VTGRVVTPESSLAFMTFFLIQIKGSRELQQPRRAPHYKKPILAVLFKLRQAFSFLDGQQIAKIRGQSTFICELR
jgi:hypothetical protein